MVYLMGLGLYSLQLILLGGEGVGAHYFHVKLISVGVFGIDCLYPTVTLYFYLRGSLASCTAAPCFANNFT